MRRPLTMHTNVQPNTDTHSQSHLDYDPYGKHSSHHGYSERERAVPCVKTEDQALAHNSRTKKSKYPIEQHACYVALCVDPHSGKIQQRSSADLRQFRHELLDEAAAKLYQLMRGGQIVRGAEILHSNGNRVPSEPKGKKIAKRDHGPSQANKKRKMSEESDLSDATTANGFAPRGGDGDEHPDDMSSKQVSYRADAKFEWEKWFNDAFRAVQQVACRAIAKEWIKAIHPKKQSTHPYNGKNPRTGERGDSDSTKPPYWPKDVIHREPDHINKEARTKLLVHLLMHTPHQEMSISGEVREIKEITAEVLKESLEQKKLERQMCDLRKKFAIVEKIIEVRTYLEQYECGGLQPSTLITAPNYSDFSRNVRNEEDSDDADDAVEVNETEGEAVEGSDARADDEWEVVPAGGHDQRKQSVPDITDQRTSSKSSRSMKRRANSPRTTAPELYRAQSQAAHAMSTGHLVHQQHPNTIFHPPMITPAWETYHSGPGMMGVDQHLFHQQAQSGTRLQDQFGPVEWGGPIHPGLDDSMPYGDHMMLSPSPIPTTMPRDTYMDGRFTQPTFGGPSAASPYSVVCDLRHAPQSRHAPQFDTYMATPGLSATEQTHRAYFG